MPHIGRNIYRIRNFIGMNQHTLAALLNVSQQAVSKYEQSENIEEEILIRIAAAMGVTLAFIKAVAENKTHSYQNITSYTADKLANAYEDHIKTKIALYERLIKEKDEQIAILDKQLNQ